MAFLAPHRPQAQAAPQLAAGKFVPLRENNQPDGHDAQRVQLVWRRWKSQDSLLRNAHRQIEDNLRMLAGQQWGQFNALLGKFVDISRFMSERDKRWRHRPVMNSILRWYILTHARMTESTPVVSFVPGPDRLDAELAEVMDELAKHLWRKADTTEAIDRIAAWLIPGGSVFWQTRADFQRGPLRPWVGRAEVPYVTPEGAPMAGENGEPLSQEMDDVPFDEQGNPVRVLTPDGPMDGYRLNPATGIIEPAAQHFAPEGEVVIDVMSPFEVRTQWGPTPHHLKRWHARVGIYTVDEVYQLTGQWCEPDIESGMGADLTELHRALLGSGYFGAASADAALEGTMEPGGERFVTVATMWEAPCNLPGMERKQPGDTGGRFLIVTPTKCLFDGPRPGAFRYTSPIRRLDFVGVPGRPLGTTPQEILNPVQRAMNRGWQQQLMHRDLVTNPIALIDEESGLAEEDWTNEPGQGVKVRFRANADPVRWLQAPSLGPDHYRISDQLAGWFEQNGNLEGTAGEPPSRDQSGEAVRELRFNSDRFLGPTMRRFTAELARMVEDKMVWLPLVYDREQVLNIAGEDNRARALLVYPELFAEGQVGVYPDMESMLPEGRGERQLRVWRMWKEGAFGMPPEAPGPRKIFLELSRFPHLARTARPGGADRVTAEQNLGKLLLGEIPSVYPWHDIDVHLEVLEDFMKSPQFERQEDEIRDVLAQYWELLNSQLPLWRQAQAMRQSGGLPAPMGGGVDGGGDPVTSAGEGLDPALPQAPQGMPSDTYPTVPTPQPEMA